MIVLAGLAAGLVVCAVVVSVVVIVMFVRMRLSRPRVSGLVVQPPVLTCMHAAVVAVGPYQWLAVVQSSEWYVVSFREY